MTQPNNSTVHISVPPALKSRWIAAARAAGLTLSEWASRRIEGGDSPPPGQFGDQWISGTGIVTESEYLIRTARPRCIVEITEPETAKRYSHEGRINKFGEAFFVVQWLDPLPEPAIREAILAEAISANEAFTLDSEAEIDDDD